MATAKFFVRQEFKDGHLKERMEAENLPAILKMAHAKDGRIQRVEYECSEELALALLNAGCPVEFVEWTPATLEYRREHL